MKVSMKLLLCFVPCLCALSSILSEGVTPDAMLDKTLDTWTTVDTVRSIAREDRHHLYPRLIKAHLDLYATTYWFTAHQPKESLSPHYIADLNELFSALSTAQKETLTGQSLSDNGQAPLVAWNPTATVPLQEKNLGGLMGCMIMDYTHNLWHHFTDFTSPKKS